MPERRLGDPAAGARGIVGRDVALHTDAMNPAGDEARELRAHEVVSDTPLPADATLAFIGTIHTPWATRDDCPHQGSHDGPDCRIVVDPPWDRALHGIEDFETIEVLYWLHRSRRDLLRQNPKRGDSTRGTFALRSPQRPNPIGTAPVRLVRREGRVLVVRGLDCVDGTPLIDLKPDRCLYTPLATGARPVAGTE
jgi:tRNA-Thr(GGU) m(6)t(6)A37 methyltransferase TsaA